MPAAQSPTEPLLTIAVPTYNRCRHLAYLLRTLEHELQGLHADVTVLVSDNASTDDTPAVVADFLARIPSLQSRRNEVNEGADLNVSTCYLLPQTPYVWVLGDDDAPMAGVLPLLIELLRRESPDMLYLPSVATDDIERDHPSHRVARLEAVDLRREDFATVLHVQMTFISGLVLRKSASISEPAREHLRVTQGTSLPQLAWVLESLKQGRKFLVCRGHPLMATAVNRGGYAVFQVFIVNHTRLVMQLLAEHPAMQRSILNRMSLCFLPGLVWHVRAGSFGDFEMLSRGEIEMPDALARTGGYRWLVRPIWSLPALPAKIAFFLSRVTTFTVRQYQRFVLFPRHRSIEVTP